MGWTFTHGATKEKVIADRIRTQETEQAIYTVLKHTTIGNVLWTVQEIIFKETGEKKRFIGCDLLRYEKDYGYGYKDLEESMHPYQYNCPLSYLAMVPVANEKWRWNVRKYHANKNYNFNMGDVVKLKECKIPEVTLTSVKPLRGIYNGILYRIMPRHIDIPFDEPMPLDDEDKFKIEHKNDYISLAAWGDWHEKVEKGFVGVFAGRGGRTPEGSYPEDTAYFLVPSEEYETDKSRYGFVIDEARHTRIDPIS